MVLKVCYSMRCVRILILEEKNDIQTLSCLSFTSLIDEDNFEDDLMMKINDVIVRRSELWILWMYISFL